MNNEDFIDYLDNRLLSRFDVKNIEFTLFLDVINNVDVISFYIGRLWSSCYNGYSDFFNGKYPYVSFFEHCGNFLKYQDYDYLRLTENDLKFLKIMSSCVECSSMEELELRLSIMGI